MYSTPSVQVSPELSSNSIMQCLWCDFSFVYTCANHPFFRQTSHPRFKWLIHTNHVKGGLLGKRSATTRNVLHLNAQILNCVDDWSHHVTTVGVQHEHRNNSHGNILNVFFKTFSMHMYITLSFIHAAMLWHV